MNLDDTIAAIASAHASGAPRGIVRLAGPDTRAALRSILSPAPTRRGAHSAMLRLPGRFAPIEVPALVLFYEGPRSYTGQDGAEIILPGNAALLRRALDALLIYEGVRIAQPGEFTARAFLAGRMSAEQAEGVAALIAAGNDAELDAARRVLDGSLGEKYRALADDIAAVLALIEAELDFADEEDVVAITDDELSSRLGSIERALIDLGADSASPGARESRSADPSVVLVGAPNAGKSTLFNALLRGVGPGARSVVSDTPGTTRDAIAERISIQNGGCREHVMLVDLAGLDPSALGIDAQAQTAVLTAIERADALIWCDPSGRFDAGELPTVRAPIIRVRTKCDLAMDERESKGAALSVCALDGRRLDALRRAIADAVGTSKTADEAALLPRHAAALGEALSHVRDASASGARELKGDHLRGALDAIGQIAGEVSPDDVLGRIFATFCIGK